ncbi:MAG: hypothetical protein ACE5H4_15980 [Candidatus Thorarchaeota archaeon]
MSESQVCTFRFRNGLKSIRFNIRYFPSDSRHPEEIVAHLTNMLRSALVASLAE